MLTNGWKGLETKPSLKTSATSLYKDRGLASEGEDLVVFLERLLQVSTIIIRIVGC
jgi:hypothetical protein